jgi:peptide/nickel transport system substrate-binding protein
MRKGLPLHLELVSFTGSATADGTEVFVQDAWRRIGVDVTIKNFSSSQLYATLGAGGIEQSGKFDVAFENWANGSDPDESILVRCDMAPPAGWNIYHFCSTQLDEAESRAMNAYDRATRKAMYGRVQRIIASQLPFIVLWYQRQLDVVNTDFRDYRPAHAVTPFWNTWEWSI